jgi:hypothetical protein
MEYGVHGGRQTASPASVAPDGSGAPSPFLADDNLIDHNPWVAEGYTITPFLDADSYDRLRRCIQGIIYDIIRDAGRPVDEATPLEHCHRLFAGDDWLRKLLLRQAQFYDERIAVPLPQVVERISSICGVPLKAKRLQEAAPPLFCLRVVPPGETARVSPFHRDVWLECYRGTISFWVPLAGCDERTTLRVLPGSHFWPDSELQMVGFSAVGWSRDVKPVRPNPRPNEVLVFTSHLVHGAGHNDSADVTRVSLEMRLCRGVSRWPLT